jgi:N6-adenosine-specific RNA methylase IME4
MPPQSLLQVFRNQEGNARVVVLDLPKTIEEAQLPAEDIQSGKQPSRRLISAPPPELPFPTPEPKANKDGQLTELQGNLSSAAYIRELTTGLAVNEALDGLESSSFRGPWCLPRIYAESEAADRATLGDAGSQKRTIQGLEEDDDDQPEEQSDKVYYPPGSRHFNGSIQAHREAFIAKALVFDLIILDPPWPNRSAKRKRGNYTVAHDFSSIRELLLSVPIRGHLSTGGLVGVWVTNAPRCIDMLTHRHWGVFEEWGVEVVDEWTWLKVTTKGEPIVNVKSVWRKPWERLLIAQHAHYRNSKIGGGTVIVAVPDVHSRKPNLRGLFDEILDPGYRALEVFARSLTAGWWSWGDQVLHFQHEKHWRDLDIEEKQS